MQSCEVTTIMIADETPPRSDAAPPELRIEAANDNAPGTASPIDSRIVVIARALGRLIAREQSSQCIAANDNSEDDAQEDAQ